MAKKIKLGFIGCGGILSVHLDHGLKSFPDVDFVGWCDLNEQAATKRCEQVGGRGAVFTDAKEMLRHAKPDAVFIMLPPFAHGPAEKLLISHRLPFFIEKPIALDMTTARAIARSVKKHRLITAVGYMNRYRQGVQQVRKLLKKNKPVIMHGGWVSEGPDNYEGQWKWLVRKDRSGGQFVEQSTHTTDLARYLFGEVTHVYAVPVRSRRRRPRYFSVEDASMVQLKFAGGAAANIYSSWCTGVGTGIGLTVWGTDILAQFSDWAHKVTIDLPDGEHYEVAGEENIFAIEDRAFVDSVKAGRNRGILATYEDGVKATAIGCAANESMRTGRVVKVAN